MKHIYLTILILTMPWPAHACRFWVGVGNEVNNSIVEQLTLQPNSLKELGKEYQDGWSVGYFYNGQLNIKRSALPSHIDPVFEQTVQDVSKVDAPVMFSHLRRASSGCVEGVANPHPFLIEKDGKTWAFGHNGGMKKSVLIDLIGDEYLNDNQPVICTDEPPDTWIDSELYLIYLIKHIEQSGGDVEAGLKKGLLDLYEVLPEDKRYLNFFLTDGRTVWTFRKGTSLYYLDGESLKFVSSTVPAEEIGLWKEFPEDTLGIMTSDREIQFIPINTYVSNH